jgi:RHS repeat-associated protein
MHQLPLARSATFAYNPASQIISTVRTGDPYAWTGHFNENKTGTPNGLNQLTSVGAKSLSHDARGNVTAFGTRAFAYSSENLLAAGPNSTSLAYDPVMRLYQTASGASTSRFSYDGLDRIAEYDEYGKPQSTNLGRFQYTGQAWIPEAGLYYYKARMYHPGVGRFLQPDPIGYDDGMNLYAYVGHDPVNLTDPLGLEWVERCVPSENYCETSWQPAIIITGTRGGWGPPATYNMGPGNPGEPRRPGGSGGPRRPEPGPQASSCTSLLAGPIYRAGGMVTTAGGGLMAVGGTVAIAGAGTPASAVGGAIAAFGLMGVAVGTFAQVNAGIYFALHGNPEPLRESLLGTVVSLVKAPAPAGPSRDAVASSIMNSKKSNSKCAP